MEQPAIILGRARSRGTRWRRGLLIGLASLLAAVLLAILMLFHMTAIDPPEVADRQEPPLEIRGERIFVGPSWMTHERGIWELHLEGDPFAMGFAHARLGSRLLAEEEEYLFDEMHRYVPSRLALFFIRMGVRLKYRHMADYVPLDRQLEIAGLAHGYPDPYEDFLPTFHRMLFYHALHDITQGVEHSPFLACSAFAAAGPATLNGHVIIGRNFDFEGPEPFDRDKAVLFYKPQGKLPFASVAWAGMTGVVTGINAERIYVSINAARTDDKGGDGIPVELLTRELLERARSVDEAVAVIRSHPVMVSDLFLVVDGKTGELAVVERTPTRTEVRRERDTILVTNHALTPPLSKDVENDRLRRYLTSGARLRRLGELVNLQRGVIDPRRALEILRDKKGVGGEPLGLGNRNALDALIATHSVVVDASTMTLWVSQGPHCLGRYVGYDLRRELLGEERPHPPDLPEDPAAASEEVRAARQAHAELKYAFALLARGEEDRALEATLRALALEEKLAEAHKLLGDLLREQDRDRARHAYQRFLELQPPYLRDVEEVKGILSSL